MLAGKIWPNFQGLKSHNSVTAQWNITILCYTSLDINVQMNQLHFVVNN